LELTVIGFAWQFTSAYSFAGVIWCLGWSMIILSPLVRLPMNWIAAFAAILILFHDLLDGISPAKFGALTPFWQILHSPGGTQIAGHRWFVLFPIVPWVGVMALGYCLGIILMKPAGQRKRIL